MPWSVQAVERENCKINVKLVNERGDTDWIVRETAEEARIEVRNRIPVLNARDTQLDVDVLQLQREFGLPAVPDVPCG